MQPCITGAADRLLVGNARMSDFENLAMGAVAKIRLLIGNARMSDFENLAMGAVAKIGGCTQLLTVLKRINLATGLI